MLPALRGLVAAAAALVAHHADENGEDRDHQRDRADIGELQGGVQSLVFAPRLELHRTLLAADAQELAREVDDGGLLIGGELDLAVLAFRADVLELVLDLLVALL